VALPRPVSERTAEAIASHLHAIGQPVRIRLLDQLDRGGEQPVGVLAQEIDQSLHNTSQHLAVLLQAGAVVRHRRGRQVWYALADTTAPAIYELVGQRLADLAAQRLWHRA
jgi:DNA-binding transcriptional ArsR family regulator